ncbi:hypothetical protein [Desulfoferrobacter suflitae]|uniref:hypothetical protein n=1 Tax=Desulfoferrobacter suflitae TaxID=2865782 RepID=UPI002164012F|nr:hypothetical protein [Desulfoferrobacter suflitae]MCK8603721.1 hypothetical protein [Desulfoferrobacter suflitae]
MVDTKSSTLMTAVAVCLIILLGVSAPVVFGATSSHTPEHSDLSEISQVRRSLRSACAKIKTIDAEAKDEDGLLHKAEAKTALALNRWQRFLKDHADATPPVFAQNMAWKEAAQAVEGNMRQMLKAVETKDVKTAFSSCGRTCRNFVEMNQKAGIELTTDVLFRFRKAAKSLQQQVRDKNLAEITPAVQTLLDLKKRAVSHPVDGTGAIIRDTEALERFSESVDVFADAVHKADENEVGQRYRQMMALMETAYDRYL